VTSGWASRRSDVGNARDDGHAVRQQQRPLVAELRTATEDDDQLRRTLTPAQIPKTTKTFGTLPVAATPRATAAAALADAFTISSRRADPCRLRASITEATMSISG
jgi:hypothetical protein